MTTRLVFNIIAICGVATFAGVMLSIGLILGAYWKSLAPAAFLHWFGANAHFIARSIPIVVVPAAIGLAVSLWLGWPTPARFLWLAALAGLAGVMIITVAYHLPANAVFEAKSIALEEVPAALDRWLWLHAARIALGLTAAVLGVLALSRQAA